MRLQSSPEKHDRITIDERIMPLINIVFLLLIFFIVAGTIREVEPFEITPPQSIAEAMVDKPDLMIALASDGRLAVDQMQITLAEFDKISAAEIKNSPERQIRIVADDRASAVTVISLMESLRRVGAENVHLTTRMKDG